MKYVAGTVLWIVPIRYWENQEPDRFVVTNELHEGHQYVRGLFDGDPEETFAQQTHAYYSKEAAIEAATLCAEIYNLKSTDDAEYIIDQIFKARKNGETYET